MNHSTLPNWSDFFKYENISEELLQIYPIHGDYYLLLDDIIKHKKPHNRVLGICGVLPVKNPRTITTLNFVSISTNKTKYAALKDIQYVFGTFYNESGIFPNIEILPKNLILSPNEQNPKIRRKLKMRGTLIYGIERQL